MLNRKIPPAIHDVRHLELPEPEHFRLDNGIPVFMLNYPGMEVFKLEVVFFAGRPEEHKRLTGRAAAQLVREGSRTRNAAEIAEILEFYGSSFSTPTSLDAADFVLYTLRKYAPDVFPVFAEAVLEPAYAEHELETYRENSIRELMVELDKVEVVAYRSITEAIYGAEHPYGYNSTPDDYRALNPGDLHRHHKRWFTPENCTLLLSGDVQGIGPELLNRWFGQVKAGNAAPADFRWRQPFPTPSTLKLPHLGSLQTAVKIGRRLFNRQHPDYNGMYVLSTILGGYFGSRLMLNIREKKGYTYNIYTTLDTMLHDGYLYTATEVSPGKAAATIRQIFREMDILCREPVPEAELDMVRNYLLGMLLNGLDGPMNTSDVVKSMVADRLPFSAFAELVKCIREIRPENLLELAQKYFRPEDYWVVTVG